jgi:outer membrane immunogenic protein
MGKVAFAALFAACFVVSGAAGAADLSLKDTPADTPEVYVPVVAPVWTGFYGGVHGGYGWGDVDVTDVFVYNADPRADNSFDSDGLIAGVQVGYNIQRGNFVFGVEADLGYMNLSGSLATDLPTPDNDPNNAISGKYDLSGGLYGDLTGRIGYATGKTLLYAKGGVAFLNAELSTDYVGANCSTKPRNACDNYNPSKFAFENEETLVGWTVGVGVEYALTSSLSLKVEYQHFDFGTMSNEYGGKYAFGCDGKCVSELNGKTDTDVTIDAVKVGLNYQFNGVEEALK